MSWERVEKRQDFEPIEPNIREEALKLRVTVVNSTMMRKQLDCIDQCIVEHGEGRIYETRQPRDSTQKWQLMSTTSGSSSVIGLRYIEP